MSDALYDTDIVTWSETQADLLRRVARGEQVNGVDWEHVVEEIEDVGNSEFKTVESLWLQAMLHLLKLLLLPDDLAANHWRQEITAFLATASRRYVPSMRQKMALQELWEQCLAALEPDYGHLPAYRSLPADCPWTIEQLCGGHRGTLLAAIGRPSG